MDLSKLKCFQIEKPKRKTVRKQVKEAQSEQIEIILIALRDKKRSIPKEWVNGFNSAISLIEGMKK
jgi:predicted ATP-grasp superfamily ATP-dependent carboligase